jgi:hypothetical protein
MSADMLFWPLFPLVSGRYVAACSLDDPDALVVPCRNDCTIYVAFMTHGATLLLYKFMPAFAFVTRLLNVRQRHEIFRATRLFTHVGDILVRTLSYRTDNGSHHCFSPSRW